LRDDPGLHRLTAHACRQRGIVTPMHDLARCHVANYEVSRVRPAAAA
jgi:hypothetical protein